jgi:hypothetical protein
LGDDPGVLPRTVAASGCAKIVLTIVATNDCGTSRRLVEST